MEIATVLVRVLLDIESLLGVSAPHQLVSGWVEQFDDQLAHLNRRRIYLSQASPARSATDAVKLLLVIDCRTVRDLQIAATPHAPQPFSAARPRRA